MRLLVGTSMLTLCTPGNRPPNSQVLSDLDLVLGANPIRGRILGVRSLRGLCYAHSEAASQTASLNRGGLTAPIFIPIGMWILACATSCSECSAPLLCCLPSVTDCARFALALFLRNRLSGLRTACVLWAAAAPNSCELWPHRIQFGAQSAPSFCS